MISHMTIREKPAAAEISEQDIISRENAKATPANRACLPAGWKKTGALVDRRMTHRSAVSFPVQLQPLDKDLIPDGNATTAWLINISSQGARLELSTPVSAPYVLIHWQDKNQRKHEAILHLKWCRSTGQKTFHSGGRVLGIR